jgi:hypothetical protein
MQHQEIVGEPDLDCTVHSLRKQEGLCLSSVKTSVGDMIGESQGCRYPDIEKHS